MKFAVGIVTVPALAIPAPKFKLAVVVTVLVKEPVPPTVTNPVKVTTPASLSSVKTPSIAVTVPTVKVIPRSNI